VPGTRALTLALAAEMVRLAGGSAPEGAASPDAALVKATAALDRGQATEKFLALVQAQGGDSRALEHGEPFHPAPSVMELKAPRAGHLAACDCFGVGEAVVAMGGGRRAKEDAVDPRVGLVMTRERGAKLAAGEVFATLHLAAPDAAMAARVTACFTFADAAPAPLPADLVLERVTA
jgi:thymidine phosphorylase